MTTRERFLAVMSFEPCDRSLDWENGIWQTAIERWYGEGLPRQPGEPDTINVTGRIYFSLLDEYLGLDAWPRSVPVNAMPLPSIPRLVFEETADRMTVLNDWGLKMIVRKDGDGIPHFVEHPVKSRADFARYRERFALSPAGRYPANWAEMADHFEKRDYVLAASDYPFGFFGFARELMGFEGLMYALYDDPALVREIMDFVADFLIAVWEKALIEAKPDFFRVWEDMCYKNGPLISPAMFREFMLQPYKRLTGFLRDCGCRNILVDTDGNCTELIPLFLEAGVTGLYPFECQSGMDVVEVRKNFPRLQMIGGLDKRALARGRNAIDEEVERKLAPLLSQGGYIPHADHFVPPDVSWEDFRHYRLRVKEMLYAHPVRGSAKP